MTPTQHIEIFERLERAQTELKIAQKKVGAVIPETVGIEARRLIRMGQAIDEARCGVEAAVELLEGK